MIHFQILPDTISNLIHKERIAFIKDSPKRMKYKIIAIMDQSNQYKIETTYFQPKIQKKVTENSNRKIDNANF